MPLLASNFTSNSLQGTVSVENGFANVNLQVEPFALEGNKSFVIKLRKDSFSGTVLSTSAPITITDNSTIATVTANISSVAEGNLVQFTVTTTNVINNANLFFSVLPRSANITFADFTANIGMVTIVNNTGTFTLRANADLSLMDETDETFAVQMRTNSPTGNIVFSNLSNVTILDVSKGFNILSFVENSSSVAEGGTLTLTFNATNIPVGTVLYYSTDGNATTSTFTGGNTGSFVMNGLSNTVTLLPTAVPYSATQNFTVQIREGSPTGTLLATSNNIIAIDSALISYISATGGNVTTSNGYRVHTFTTSGNLTVSALGFAPGNFFDYLVVAGGGGATTYSGAGAGGFRTGSGLSVIQGTYAITVGAGGSGTNTPVGTYGSDSIFSTITSTGGGRGVADGAGGNGGSGGGGYGGLSPGSAGGLGNTPSTSPPQGNNGGRGLTDNINYTASGGGGGAGAVGGNAAYQAGGNGGSGAPSSISGSNVMYAGGGGGRSNAGTSGSGGTGGGGPATNTGVGTPGTINTGGGGGGGGLSPGGSGGSGIIIIRYPYIEPITISNVVTTATAFIVGSNITFTINATNGNATTLYYTTDGNVTASNFIGGNTGSFVANVTGGIVTLQANTNIPLNESRSFRLQIRQDSTTGFISGSSANVIVSAYSTYTSASGGNQVIDDSGYRHHIFLSSNTLTINSLAQTPIEVFSVAGGGGSATALTGPGSPTFHGTGGGGAGGLLISNISLSLSPVSVVVGAGGQSAVINNAGYPGSNTTFGSYLTMVGGGGGGRDSSGKNGGSGGGGGGYNAYSAGSGYGFPSPTQQGYPGGAGGPASPSGDGGGGGGAGSAGAGGGSIGTGGIGVALSWAIPTSYGTSGPAPGRWFAGGGGGGANDPAGGGAPGGAGGGGDVGTSAIVNTGGGGGGHGNDGYNTSVGLGGSGIVIIRYPYI